MAQEKKRWTLFKRKECWIPTWKGWLTLIGSAAILSFVFAKTIEPFLSVNAPKPGGALVIEGWAADYAMEAAVEEFRRNHYDRVFVTGGPIEQGAPLSEYKTYAELGAAVLSKLGLKTNELQAIPAPYVVQDRTYNSAVTLRKWLAEHGTGADKITVFTVGAHARRSRLLFAKAFGEKVSVGVISVGSRGYDPAHWWRSSMGVRTVVGETTAYLYARLLFHPSNH